MDETFKFDINNETLIYFIPKPKSLLKCKNELKLKGCKFDNAEKLWFYKMEHVTLNSFKQLYKTKFNDFLVAKILSTYLSVETLKELLEYSENEYKRNHNSVLEIISNHGVCYGTITY
jgi:hypothetical protein